MHESLCSFSDGGIFEGYQGFAGDGTLKLHTLGNALSSPIIMQIPD